MPKLLFLFELTLGEEVCTLLLKTVSLKTYHSQARHTITGEGVLIGQSAFLEGAGPLGAAPHGASL